MRETSLEAYASVAEYLPTLEGRVLQFVAQQGAHGATLEEMSDGTGIKIQSTCGARLKLERTGVIIDAGLTRKTRSGRSAKVWRLPL